MREPEFRYAVHPSFVIPPVEGHGGVSTVKEMPSSVLATTYWDTQDLRLARQGATLSFRRSDNGNTSWIVKLPPGRQNGAAEGEIEIQGSRDPIPQQAAELVTAFARSAVVGEVATLETKRSSWRLLDAGGRVIAILLDDEVSLLEADSLVARFREVELKRFGGNKKDLGKIGSALRAAGAMPSEPIPKMVRALGPNATAPPDIPVPTDVKPSDPAGMAIRAAIATSVRRLIDNDPAARMGDPEGVHQMRVATRRLRSDLRTFAPLVDEEWSSSLVVELKWLGRVLGEVRDLDVLRAHISDAAEGLESDLEPLFDELKKREEKVRDELAECLRSDLYKDLLDKLIAAAIQPRLTPDAEKASGDVLVPLVRPVWKTLTKKVRHIGLAPTGDELHKIRVACKKTRYAAEAVAESIGDKQGKKAAKFARGAASVQDVLGLHQDMRVACSVIQEIVRAGGDGALSLAAGRLIERLERLGEEAQNEWRKPWDKLNQKKRTSWLKPRTNT